MSTVSTEQVMVVKTELLHEIGYFEGFQANVQPYLETLLNPLNTQYLPRDQMEQDPSYKQLIPYCIFQTQGTDGPLVFQYRRGSSSGESRLRALRSVGVGGHVSSEDQTEASPYEVGMQRELDEEVVIDTTYSQRLIGLINDDSNEVGQVHLGIVHLFEVEQPRVASREEHLVEEGFQPADQLMSQLDEFETWSQFCLRELYG